MHAATFIFWIYVLWTVKQMLLHLTAKICISSKAAHIFLPHAILLHCGSPYWMLRLVIFYLNAMIRAGHRVQSSAMRGLMTIRRCLFVSITTAPPLLPLLHISDSLKPSSNVLNVSLKQSIPISYYTLCPLAWVIPLSPSRCSPDLFAESKSILPFHLHTARLSKPSFLISSLKIVSLAPEHTNSSSRLNPSFLS